MLRRVLTVVGCVSGWVVAVMVGFWPNLPWSHVEPVMLLSLSVALLSSACMALQRHQRPLGAAYELGYDMGRRDAIREFTQRSNVSPIRRVPRGLSEFNRSAGA